MQQVGVSGAAAEMRRLRCPAHPDNSAAHLAQQPLPGHQPLPRCVQLVLLLELVRPLVRNLVVQPLRQLRQLAAPAHAGRCWCCEVVQTQHT
jgi:hypothetical protein